MDADKRENERKVFFADAVLEFASGKYEARISDISLGGCYVDSIASVAKGQLMSVTIAITPEKSQRYDGEVAYVLSGFGFGMRFTDLTEEKAAFLRRIAS